MELIEAIRTRRSIRQFTDRPVPEAMIGQIIEAGMMAPSAGNQQPWHFLVISDRDKLTAMQAFHPYSTMAAKAAVSILVCGEPEGLKYPQLWPQDCAAATQNMLLAARDLGLGTVWVGIYPLEERMAGCRTLWGIPEKVVPFALVPVGWPAATFAAVDRFKPDRIHHERW